jgi:hypothetical protein
MLLHWTPDLLPALLTVILASLTSFLAHDLRRRAGQAHRVRHAGKSSRAEWGSRTLDCRKTCSSQLPFASAPLFHCVLAAR